VAETILEYQQSHRHLTTADVRQALKLAQEDTGGSNKRLAFKALAVGLLAMLGAGVFAYRRIGEAGPEQWGSMVFIVGGLVVALAVVAAVKRSR
jgi:formate/nitrite transporter FocA (FNT family)